MSGNPILIAMRPAPGLSTPSELHVDGLVLKPDQHGIFQVPSDFVVTLWHAGYVWAPPILNTATRNPAQTTL